MTEKSTVSATFVDHEASMRFALLTPDASSSNYLSPPNPNLGQVRQIQSTLPEERRAGADVLAESPASGRPGRRNTRSVRPATIPVGLPTFLEIATIPPATGHVLTTIAGTSSTCWRRRNQPGISPREQRSRFILESQSTSRPEPTIIAMVSSMTARPVFCAIPCQGRE